jgi:hypothetical protein
LTDTGLPRATSLSAACTKFLAVFKSSKRVVGLSYAVRQREVGSGRAETRLGGRVGHSPRRSQEADEAGSAEKPNQAMTADVKH